MRLRLLLALQLLFSLVVLSAFLYFAGITFWSHYALYLPSSVPLSGTEVRLSDVFLTYGGALWMLIVLTFVLMYLIFDRLVIVPIKSITHALKAFTETQSFTPLPRLHLASKEMKELTKEFIEFTNNVEKVHERDLEISRVKSDFISTAAHQLRTPLTGIRWALEALAKEQLTDTQKLLVDDAANKSRDLVAIVGTLLDISSIESGKHKYVFEATDILELASSITNDFMRFAGEKSVQLQFVTPQAMPPKVRADREQIKWVLNNLIENGIRYTPSGGSVQVSVVKAPERVQILVSDTGIGIASKDKNNIFERFYRAENAIAKENKGNGLGLYIARTIATDHGGDLTFAPNTGGTGTTFTLSLPAL